MAFLGNLGGSTPQVNRYPEGAGLKRLFHSQRDISLIIDKTCRAGYGYLLAGTVLAEDEDSMCVPYVPATAEVDEDSALGCAVILAVSDEGVVRLPAGQAGKFAVDDVIMKVGDEYETEITISAITYGTNYDTITVDEYSDLAADDLLMLSGADTAKYILDQDVDTGSGEDAKGANASVVLSNAVLYSASLINLDATAITALGGSSDGQFFILK